MIYVAHLVHGESPEAIAENYDLPVEAVYDALAYFEAHREIIETLLHIEDEIAARYGKTETPS